MVEINEEAVVLLLQQINVLNESLKKLNSAISENLEQNSIKIVVGNVEVSASGLTIEKILETTRTLLGLREIKLNEELIVSRGIG